MRMTAKDLTKKDRTELTDMLAEERATLRNLEFKVGEGQLKDVRSLRESKRTIARILTALNSLEEETA